MPTQFIAGNVDGFTLGDSSRNVEGFYSAGYQRVDLAAAGHFPHREQPGKVADLILIFAADAGPRSGYWAWGCARTL